jgi:hypothetical protein
MLTLVILIGVGILFHLLRSADIDSAVNSKIKNDLKILQKQCFLYLEKHCKHDPSLPVVCAVDIKSIPNPFDRQETINNFKLYYSYGYYWIGCDVPISNPLLTYFSSDLYNKITHKTRVGLERSGGELLGTSNINVPPSSNDISHKYKASHQAIWLYVK